MKLMSKNNLHHCFSALIPVFVFFFFSFLRAHSFPSSGGIISSVDVPSGTRREDGRERELVVAVPPQQIGGCVEEPV